MSWWKIIKNRRNIKIPKRRNTKEVPKHGFSRPVIRTKEQIQAEQEKLKEKGKKQAKINTYVRYIEDLAKRPNDSLIQIEREGESYSRRIDKDREKLEELERDLGYEDEKVLALQKDIDERAEEMRFHIAHEMKYKFINNVRRFIEAQERRKKQEAGYDLDNEDKQIIDTAFANTKKTLIELYKKYDKYVDIFKYMSMIGNENFDGQYDEYQKLKNKLR